MLETSVPEHDLHHATERSSSQRSRLCKSIFIEERYAQKGHRITYDIADKLLTVEE
jgi:hypothetical protein